MRSRHDFPSVNTKLPDGLKPGGIPYKILVVEDSEFQRKQIRQFLESEDYEVVADVANGQDAMRVLDSLNGKVDLVCTDLDMPVMDGYALLHEIKLNRKFNVKVVFVSEETTKGVLQDLIKMGALDFILKPLQRGRILERVKAAISR